MALDELVLWPDVQHRDEPVNGGKAVVAIARKERDDLGRNGRARAMSGHEQSLALMGFDVEVHSIRRANPTQKQIRKRALHRFSCGVHVRELNEFRLTEDKEFQGRASFM